MIVAVVQRAIQDVAVDLADVPKKDRCKIRMDAIQWFSRNTPDRPFSFQWCTDVLEWDSETIRRLIKAVMNNTQKGDNSNGKGTGTYAQIQS